MNAAIAHLFGDYVVQTDHMAARKTQAHGPAAAHALTYTACFLPLTRDPRALATIGLTHFVIDRWRLARHVVWAKNQAAPRAYRYPWSHARGTGYHDPITTRGSRVAHDTDQVTCGEEAGRDGKVTWMAVWLMIIADNSMHLLVNDWALKRWAR